MGFFSKVLREAKRFTPMGQAKKLAQETGEVVGAFTGGLEGPIDTSEADAAARLEAEAREDKRRKLLAEQSRTQTSPTGTGVAPQVGRRTITGV